MPLYDVDYLIVQHSNKLVHASTEIEAKQKVKEMIEDDIKLYIDSDKCEVDIVRSELCYD